VVGAQKGAFVHTTQILTHQQSKKNAKKKKKKKNVSKT
jgi:hypothetical protein